MANTFTVSGEGITLDKLLWRHYGARGYALLETALAANPGLAVLGPILPLGTSVVIPDLPQASAQTVTVVTLFG